MDKQDSNTQKEQNQEDDHAGKSSSSDGLKREEEGGGIPENEQPTQEIEELLSPSKSASPEISEFSTTKKQEAEAVEQPVLSQEHPLSVYFRAPAEGSKVTLDSGSKRTPTLAANESAESVPAASSFEEQKTLSAILSDSPPQPDAASRNAGQAQEQLPAVESHHRSKHSAGMQSVFGSIEQSPQAWPGQQLGGTTYKSPRSQQQDHSHRTSSEAGGSSSKQQSNPADNYQFLQGIREVDDDQESMTQGGLSGTIGSHAKTPAQPRYGGTDYAQAPGGQEPAFLAGSFQGSMHGSQGDGHDGPVPMTEVSNMYGTVQATTNPFIQAGHPNGNWSSQKSRDSEKQLSFGGGEPVHQVEGQSASSPSKDNGQSSEKYGGYYSDQFHEQPDFRNQTSLVDKLLTKAYNQGLAQMGEKACMRLALKEVAVTLDSVNELMCKQAVQQELILNDETPTSQMKQIMDMSIAEADHTAAQNGEQDQKMQSLRKKTNVQLIESIRMEGQMMQMRVSDFRNKENNIYQRFVKERERNHVLSTELAKYEGVNVQESARLGGSLYHNTQQSDYVDTDNQRSSSALVNLAKNSLAYQRDTIEHDQDALVQQHQRNRTMNSQTQDRGQLQPVSSIEQLSPGSPFHVRQSPVQLYTPSTGKKNEPLLVDRQLDLAQHDGQISMRDSSQIYNLEQTRELLRQLEEKDSQIQKLHDYVEAIKREFTLYRQSSSQRLSLKSQTNQSPESHKLADESLHQNQKQHEQIIELHSTIYDLAQQNSQLEERLRDQGNQQAIKVQDGLGNKDLNVDSSSSKRYSESQNMSPSYFNSVTVQNEQSQQAIVEQASDTERSLYQKTQSQGSVANNQRIKIGGASLEDPSTMTQQHMASAHIAENSSPEKAVQDLAHKLEVQTRIAQRLDASERKLMEQLQAREKAYEHLQVLTRDLQNQASVNSSALDKAGVVIAKLNDDLQKSLDAATVLQKDNQQLKGDCHINRRQLDEQMRAHKAKEQGMEAKLQRVDHDLTLGIREGQEALGEYQREAAREMNQLQEQIKEQKDEISKLAAINTSLEAKQQADQAKANACLTAKTNEILDIHNANLSLQIQMKTVENQVQQDIEIKQDLHRREVLFLKNKINEQQQQLRTQTQNGAFFGGASHGTDQDGSEVPKISNAYLAQLNQEFSTLSDELQKMRDLTKDNSKSQLDSYIHKHMENFSQFKLKVLDSLVEWHQKSTELSRLANKYFDSLEEYKMLFVQMKQLIKEKDGIVRKTKSQLAAQKQVQLEHLAQVQGELEECGRATLLDLKKMTKLLETKVRVKEAECDQLIRYQEEFREEYVKVCTQRDELQRRNESCIAQNDHLQSELRRINKGVFDFKELLRNTLEIQDGPHAHDIVQQHAEMLVETTKTQKIQIAHYQEKSNELTLELEGQRTLFKSKMGELERQLEDQQQQYLKQQDEAFNDYCLKEQAFEQQVGELNSQVTNLSQELSLRDRQMRKHESKLEAEVHKQGDLQGQIQQLVSEKTAVTQSKEAVKESYDALEDKLSRTEQLLDQRVRQVDELDSQLKQTYERVDRLEVDLNSATAQLGDKTSRLQQQSATFESTKLELLTCQRQLSDLKENFNQLDQEYSKLKHNEQFILNSNEERINKIKALEESQAQNEREIKDMTSEIKRYQDTVSFMSRQIDEERLQQLDKAILENENQKLKDTVCLKEELIDKLYAQYVDCPKREAGAQTDTSFLDEMERAVHANGMLNAHLQEQQGEVEQLKEALRRQLNDIDRLIEEKRQLEQEISKNQSNENVNQNNYNRLRDRSNSPRHASVSTVMGISGYGGKQASVHQESKAGQDAQQLHLILREKDNYITNLNNELNDLRVENEKLKDKLIVFELDNLGQGHLAAGRTMKSSNLKPGNTLLSHNDRTLADTRSNISGAHNLTKNFTQQTGHRFESNFGQTGQYGNYLSMQDKTLRSQYQNSVERNQAYGNSLRRPNEGLLSPSMMGQQYQTQNLKAVKTPNLGYPDAATPTLQNGEEQFYTLQQTQQHSEGNLGPYLQQSMGSLQRDQPNLPRHVRSGSKGHVQAPNAARNQYQTSLSTIDQARAAPSLRQQRSPQGDNRVLNMSSIQKDSQHHEPTQIFRQLGQQDTHS